ncbi:hypothetical protein D3C87_1313470 [compost metagenome]
MLQCEGKRDVLGKVLGEEKAGKRKETQETRGWSEGKTKDTADEYDDCWEGVAGRYKLPAFDTN